MPGSNAAIPEHIRASRLLPDADGVSRSFMFPGQWLDTAAPLTGDLALVHAVSRDGLANAKLAAM